VTVNESEDELYGSKLTAHDCEKAVDNGCLDMYVYQVRYGSSNVLINNECNVLRCRLGNMKVEDGAFLVKLE
jgi:hypothetical protein